MMREYQVRICERLGVKFPGPTRQTATCPPKLAMSALPLTPEAIAAPDFDEAASGHGALTRGRHLQAPDECWHVDYGDVRVGTIAKRIGIPFDEDPWGWVLCGRGRLGRAFLFWRRLCLLRLG
jgi:hypothetical protein